MVQSGGSEVTIVGYTKPMYILEKERESERDEFQKRLSGKEKN